MDCLTLSIKAKMRKSMFVLLVPIAAGACSVPFRTSNDERKAQCDRVAAQAIQTSSIEEAKNLSAQASACYAKIQGG